MLLSVAVSAAMSSSLSFLSTRTDRAYWTHRTDRYCGCYRRDRTYRVHRADRYCGCYRSDRANRYCGRCRRDRTHRANRTDRACSGNRQLCLR